ncbi:chromosome partitioning protein ParA [Actinomadura alba]|uniref:Chromosome partitioning protein ParA n=1 Tax=Actinomadura alba TaxID=406431 RepID=A0ABR7LU79_9ACTN|nr:chromosome partitioning protein ParA [Actinomadura alba]
MNISRLSTHPVPTVPGTLIVVAGQGPKDSNGAGKSSFIAAITALLGDEQWRFASGARAVGELLFNAELAAQGESQWASADHGYIIGVFADPRQPEDTALTVWLRVNADAPHLEIRWHEGVRLASAPSEAERVGMADRVWSELPRSAGRRDLVAKDLSRVLYGGRVRCVSFLSTSVRTKVATNLLSQPLNEITPERIFSAIAALTGLDRELEAERKARSEEHRELAKAAEAAERLAEWEAEARSLLTTFDRRDRAREQAAAAERCWRARQARLVADAVERDGAYAAEQERLRRENAETADAVKAVDREIEQLTGGALEDRLAEATGVLAELKGQAEQIGEDKAVARNRLEELRRQASGLEDRQREADGRDVPAAEKERHAAEGRRDEAQQDLGLAKGRLAQAERDLAAAEAGESTAGDQIHALTAAGVPAVGLLDAVELDEAVRDRWERALWPYREAVVVASGDVDAAVGALGGLPGSMIVPAEGDLPRDQDEPCAELPEGVRCRLALRRFFTVLDGDRGDGGDGDGGGGHHAGAVVVVGGFPEPVTGRAARVQAARAALDGARDALDDTRRRASDAAAEVALAARRLEAARAAERLLEVRDRMTGLREQLEALATSEARLGPKLGAAEQSVRRLQARADTMALELDRLRGRRDAHERTRDKARELVAELTAKRAGLDLDHLLEDWGGSPDGAAEWLLGLAADERPWTPEEWWHSADRHLADGLRHVFPGGTDDEDMPEEIRFLLNDRADGAGRRSEREQATFPRLMRGLIAYLRRQEDYERHQRRQIEMQQTSRRTDLEKAQKGASEAAEAGAAHRATLVSAIRSRLQRVSEEFERLDLAYGGYGATLEFPTPEPPGDPEQEWRWRVVPKWRRSEGQRYVPYNRRANTALMDEKAVKLVCAAALASSTGRPGESARTQLVLVLDELGRNLGKEHRREAVALFRQIGETHGITVIGALQDDMEPYAIDACGQYVKLRRSSDAMPYNEPPVVIGHDEHTGRVRMLAEWISATRPSTDTRN